MAVKINPIRITERALEQIQHIMEEKSIPEDYGLRVGVKGGGCEEVSYIIGFDEKTDQDNEFLMKGIRLFIEKKDTMYLMGVEIDYLEEKSKKGFKFLTPDQ